MKGKKRKDSSRQFRGKAVQIFTMKRRVGDLLFRWTIVLNVCGVIFTSSFTSRRLAS